MLLMAVNLSLMMANELEIRDGLIYTGQTGILCISLCGHHAVVGCVKVKDTIVVHTKKKPLEYLTKVCVNVIKGSLHSL